LVSKNIKMQRNIWLLVVVIHVKYVFCENEEQSKLGDVLNKVSVKLDPNPLEPTMEPTLSPTHTNYPTEIPTYPTINPTISYNPTVIPTRTPTSEPTLAFPILSNITYTWLATCVNQPYSSVKMWSHNQFCQYAIDQFCPQWVIAKYSDKSWPLCPQPCGGVVVARAYCELYSALTLSCVNASAGDLTRQCLDSYLGVADTQTTVTLTPAIVIVGMAPQRIKTDTIFKILLKDMVASSAGIDIEDVKKIEDADVSEDPNGVKVAFRIDMSVELYGFHSNSVSSLVSAVMGSLSQAVASGAFEQGLLSIGLIFQGYSIDKPSSIAYIQTAFNAPIVVYSRSGVPSITPTAVPSTTVPSRAPTTRPTQSSRTPTNAPTSAKLGFSVIDDLTPVDVVGVSVGIALGGIALIGIGAAVYYFYRRQVVKNEGSIELIPASASGPSKFSDI